MSIIPPKDGYFPITTVHRLDIIQHFGLKPDFMWNISDEEMLEIADRMAQAYLENSYWIDLDIIAREVLENKLIGFVEEDEDVNE